MEPTAAGSIWYSRLRIQQQLNSVVSRELQDKANIFPSVLIQFNSIVKDRAPRCERVTAVAGQQSL